MASVHEQFSSHMGLFKSIASATWKSVGDCTWFPLLGRCSSRRKIWMFSKIRCSRKCLSRLGNETLLATRSSQQVLQYNLKPYPRLENGWRVGKSSNRPLECSVSYLFDRWVSADCIALLLRIICYSLSFIRFRNRDFSSKSEKLGSRI